MNFNLPDQKTVIKLIRCACKHCDIAKEVLQKLANEYGAELKVERADKKEEFRKFANWSTPIVVINGKEISHYGIDQKKWEQALKNKAAIEPLKMTGEVVCMKCYMEREAKGLSHESCATLCIQNGGTMGFLSHDEHRVYLLLADPSNKSAHEALKNFIAEKVRVIGDIYRKEGAWAIVVKGLEAIPD